MQAERNEIAATTFTPIPRDDGEPEAMFPRSHYTRSQAITEARDEYFYVFEGYQRKDLHAKAAAVRYATRDDLENGGFETLEDEEQIGSYLCWCDPSDDGAIPAWMVCPRTHR